MTEKYVRLTIEVQVASGPVRLEQTEGYCCFCLVCMFKYLQYTLDIVFEFYAHLSEVN